MMMKKTTVTKKRSRRKRGRERKRPLKKGCRTDSNVYQTMFILNKQNLSDRDKQTIIQLETVGLVFGKKCVCVCVCV